MSLRPAASTPLQTSERLVALGGFFYVLAYLLWYRVQPMGQFPVMDGFYNLELARQFADGTVPREPFFRAPLYNYLLSMPLRWGLPFEWLPDFARLVNLGAFVAAEFALLRITRLLQFPVLGRCFTLGLVAFHPLVAFYAGDPYDILPCIALMAWFVATALPLLRPSVEPLASPWAIHLPGLILAAAAALRPQFLPLALLWPLILGGLSLTRSVPSSSTALLTGLRQTAIGAWPFALTIVLLGASQWRFSGEWRALPWQGSYMLYLASDPERFSGFSYRQQVSVPIQGSRFPVELEAREIYRQETGNPAEDSPDAIAAHFRQRVFEEWREHPVASLGPLLRRAYALIHTHEQYDNKTWTLQKTLAPFFLSANPLSWGLLFALAAPGGVLLWQFRRRECLFLLGVAAAYAAVMVLTLANGRYRLPLYPLLALCAGALCYLQNPPTDGSIATRIPWRSLLGAALFAGLLTFVPLWGVADEDTRVADYTLMAHAAQATGEDREAIEWARQARAFDANRADPWELELTSAYNLATLGESELPWAELAASAEAYAPLHGTELDYIRGYFQYRAGEHESALQSWRQAVGNHRESVASQALAALILCEVVDTTPRGPTALAQLARQWAGQPRENWPSELRALFPEALRREVVKQE